MSLEDCKGCRLSETRNRVVSGSGNKKSKLMFIGEAPGREEDERGKPFVGQAGKYLDELLVLIGLQREDVYITNIVKCRPPENRDPLDDEIEACKGWLLEELKNTKPKIIITLGVNAGSVFKHDLVIKKDHGTVMRMGIVSIFFSYHPASTLYNKKNRVVMEEDFKKLKKMLLY